MKGRVFLERVQDLGGLATRQDADRWSMAVLGDLLANTETRRHCLSRLPGPLKAGLLTKEPATCDMYRDRSSSASPQP